MIATIDKFANVPWEGRTGAFFGHVERHDQIGLLSARPSQPVAPARAPNCARSISIIQDELASHLGSVGHDRRALRDGLRSAGLAHRSTGNGGGRRSSHRRPPCAERKGRSATCSVESEPRSFPRRALKRTDSFFAKIDSETHRDFMSESPRRAADRSSSSFAPCRRCLPGAAALV